MPVAVVVDRVLPLPGERREHDQHAAAGCRAGVGDERDGRRVRAPERTASSYSPAPRAGGTGPAAEELAAARPRSGLRAPDPPQRPLYGRRRESTNTVAREPGGHRIERRLDGQVSDGHAGVRTSSPGGGRQWAGKCPVLQAASVTSSPTRYVPAGAGRP